MSLYSTLLRPVLFSLDAERAHNLTIGALGSPVGRAAVALLPRPARDPRLQQRVAGIDFENPLGLAAGLDKQGTAVRAWESLGFAFAEVGTVTPRPQPGNPLPRLFRLPEDRAIVNRFGFNSEGAAAVGRHLAAGRPRALKVGVNIGKNKETPNTHAADDYLHAVDALHAYADYFVVNVSSPNTAGLRDLQDARLLRELVTAIVTHLRAVTAGRTSIPVFVKVSPDMSAAELLGAADAAMEGGASGIVATNTTVSRAGLHSRRSAAAEAGGLSGAPLRAAANAACRTLFRHLGKNAPIIGVGGIFSAEDAYDRIRAGASLVQVYTALIYEGPAVVSRILGGLAGRLERDGVRNVQDAIGTDVH